MPRHPDAPPGAAVISLDARRRTPVGSPPKGRGLMYWTAALVTLGSAMLSLALAAAGVLGDTAGRQASFHALARSLPPVLVGSALLVVHAPAGLCTLTLLVGLMQLFDFWAGILTRDPVRIGVPLLATVLTLACAIPLLAEQVMARRKATERARGPT